MVNIWFTSDTHFGHQNILKYSERPFDSIDEMDYELVQKWNSRVNPEDIIYFLGDFSFHNSSGKKINKSFEEYKNRLNGNIVFIQGNHDSSNKVKTKMISAVLEFGGMEIFCCHNPKDAHPDYKLNLCGHVHKLWKSKKVKIVGRETVLINVGVDQWNFYPVSLKQILDEYKKYDK